MGEARRKRDDLTTRVLTQIDRWTFAPSDAEAAAVAEVAALPVIHVRRWPSPTLRKMGMKPHACHVNVRSLVEGDPQKKCRQVTGWWVQQGNYLLHSVVEREGLLFCVTPTVIDMAPDFPFIPDPAVEWREEGQVRVAYRDGLKVEPGLRGDPGLLQDVTSVIRDRILSGMHPLEARKPPFCLN